MEQTFLMIKPDGVQRNLVGEIITRFEKKGLKLVGMKFLQLTREMAEDHYREHLGKDFYPELLSYITSGPVVAMVWQGEKAVALARQLVGKTDPAEADPGSIRGSFGLTMSRNLIHGADSLASAQRETAIYFQPGELPEYVKTVDSWV